jgi:hypothetical protein
VESGISLDVEAFQAFNYSMFQQTWSPLTKLSVINSSANSYQNLFVSVASESGLINSERMTLDLLPADEAVDIDTSSIKVIPAKLLQLTEQIIDVISIRVLKGDSVIAEASVTDMAAQIQTRLKPS